MAAHFIEKTDTRFPRSLRVPTMKPPLQSLWYRGEWDEKIFARCAAVVGSRRMSRYGKQVVEEIVTQLVASQYTIVSGLMYGVDQYAHRICLQRHGRAIAVVGYGIENKNEETAWKMEQEIEENRGLVISEYAGACVSQMWMFPQRNRIVAALSHIVIVVEAGLKSGSLITARLAHAMGKTIYAVPGSIFSPTSEGTHWLIEHNKAHILTLENLAEITSQKKSPTTDPHRLAMLTAGEREIYTLLRMEGALTCNQIARSLTTPAREILTLLAQMELKGVVVDDRGVWVTH